MFVKVLKNIILALFVLIFSLNVYGNESYNGGVIKAGISLTEQVPTAFFGMWRVKSKIIDTNSPANFKKENVDIWNLSKDGDVINLSNPFSGASASVTLSYVENNAIRFTKKENYGNKILTDTVEIYLKGDKFTGVNTILLQTLSDVDNSVIKTSKATYTLNGEKIAGKSIK